MRIRVLTLKYDEALGGFPEDALLKVCAGSELLESREFFFERAGVPHLCLTLKFSGDEKAEKRPKTSSPDPMQRLPNDRKKLYLDLKKKRNEMAEREGVPPFVVLRNELLAEICLQAPGTLAAMKEIPGIGEKTVKKYGKELLAVLPDGLLPAATDPSDLPDPPDP